MGENGILRTMSTPEWRVAVIYTRWNELVTDALVRGTQATLDEAGISDFQLIEVPGSWEVPLVAQAALRQGFDGVVALGCILQGETPHADLLAGDVAGALMRIQLEEGKPISWGILTPNTAEQALDRAGLKMGNKGREAASALLASLQTLRALSASEPH